MKNNNKINLMAIMSIIATGVSCLLLFWPTLEGAKIILSIGIAFAVIAIILGFIAINKIKNTKEKGKKLAIASIIIGFVMGLFLTYTLLFTVSIENPEFNDMMMCPQANECTNNGDGTSTCIFEEIEIPCTTNKLNETQMKK